MRGGARLTAGAAAAALALQPGHTQDLVVPVPGLVITQSVVFRPGVYTLPSTGLDAPALTVRGEHITIDLNGAELAGAPRGQDPDTFAGLGILVDGGRSVTVRNGTVRGYKVGLLARRSPDLRLARNDFSYNWKQRLHSGVEQESLVDWMSYHQNEQDEWLRYGAGIYLSACDRAVIERNVVTQGQNGLLAARSRGLKIYNNTFQFLSSLGVGLYRVSDSTVAHNRIDWCVRGYSHGFYNRGQDSAGLLMYEQSSHNLVAYNSITHGGDGLFLWAGQSTMDGGKGGSNDNVFYGNDFSHAATNGIEATFSRNVFAANRVEECWHGVWGGYSWGSRWLGNRFARNTEAIAIEHGQDNEIAGNTFDGDGTAIRLWQNAAQDPSWGYPRHRDTRSRGYAIHGNQFTGNRVALDLRDTRDVTAAGNRFTAVTEGVRRAGDTSGFALSDGPPLRDIGLVPPPPAAADPIDPMIASGQRRGRDTIIVDEWGPYDWKSPKLWPAGSPAARPLRLRVLGPAGEWRVLSASGATAAPASGRVPGDIVVTPAEGALVDFVVALEYRGGAVLSPAGIATPAGQPYRFEYSRFSAPADWRVRFFDHAAIDRAKKPDALSGLIAAGKPVRTLRTPHLDYISGRGFADGLPRDDFALAAEGEVELPPGDYLLHVISDDGVRVWVDGALAIDAWAPHESRVDTAPLAGGRRRLKVEYYELNGFAELRVDIRPRRTTGAR